MIDRDLHGLAEVFVHLGERRVQGFLADQDRAFVIVKLVVKLGQSSFPIPVDAIENRTDPFRNRAVDSFALNDRGCLEIDHGKLLHLFSIIAG